MIKDQIISTLWGIIDDIDTELDICKGNTEAFQKRVAKLVKLRWNTGITTDGYTLSIPIHKSNGDPLLNGYNAGEHVLLFLSGKWVLHELTCSSDDLTWFRYSNCSSVGINTKEFNIRVKKPTFIHKIARKFGYPKRLRGIA